MNKLLAGTLTALGCGIVFVAMGSWTMAEEPAGGETAGQTEKAELEKRFEETLTGATLVGFFTTRGNEEKALKPERYEIYKVTKLHGDVWAFTVRIAYGEKDQKLAVPLPLKVKWAGDTPVITLTNMPVPGFGTFTSRVLIYGDEYAGTWSGGDRGGHLFGKIERTRTEEQ